MCNKKFHENRDYLQRCYLILFWAVSIDTSRVISWFWALLLKSLMLDGTIRFDGKALAAGELLFLSPLISQTMFVLINTMQQDMTQRLCWHCFLMTPHIVCALWFLLLFIVIWVYQKLHVRLPMSVIVYWLCTVFKTSLLASYASQIKGKFKKGKRKSPPLDVMSEPRCLCLDAGGKQNVLSGTSAVAMCF